MLSAQFNQKYLIQITILALTPDAWRLFSCAVARLARNRHKKRVQSAQPVQKAVKKRATDSGRFQP
jgi:hypothetical protein